MSVQKLEAQLEALQDELNTEPANDLVKYIKRKGDYKGEILDFTPRQYRAIMGKHPRPAIINKKGNVNWELALDEIATEKGYKSDQDLKNSIERCLKLRNQIKETKHDIELEKERVIEVSDIEPTTNECLVGAASGQECKAKIVNVNGVSVEAWRQPAQWNVHVHKASSDIEIDNLVGEVRYAKDTKKVLKEIGSGIAEQHTAKQSSGMIINKGKIRRQHKGMLV